MTEQEAIKAIMDTCVLILSDKKKFLSAMEVSMKALEDVQQYREIGTLEECRVAVEKQKPKKPIYDKPIGVLECPCCGNYLQKVVDDEGSTDGFIPNHCSNCGQKIDTDWSENNESISI